MAGIICTGIVRLTRDAEFKKSTGGSWYYFGIVSYRKNVKEGKQTADFFDAELFAKEGKDVEKLLKKGNLIYIETAYLRNDQFKGVDGNEKNKIKLLIISFDVIKNEEAKEEKKDARSYHPTDLPPPIDIPHAKEKTPEIKSDSVEDEYGTEVPF